MSARDDMRKAVDQAVESVLAKLRNELVERVVTGLPEPPPPPPPPPAAGAGPDLGKLRNEVFTLMDGTGQVEILNRLMESIGHWWGRSVLFLVKGTAFQPWDARGFESHGGNAAIKAVAINEGSDTILDAALSGAGSQAGNSQLEQRLGPHQGARAAVPLGIRNKAAAILYVDSPKVDDAAAIAALETVARIGAAAIELGMLTKRTPPFVRTEAVVAPARGAKAEDSASTGFALSGSEPEIEAEVEYEVEATPAPPPPSFKAPTPPPAPSFAPPAPAPPTPSFAAPPAPAAPTFTPPAPAPAPSFAPPAPAPAPAPSFAPPAPAPSFTPRAPAPAPAAAAPASAAPATAAGPTGAIEGGALDPRELLKGGAKPVVDAGQSLGGSKTFSRWKPVRDQVKSDEVDPTLAAIPEAERPKHVDARKIARLLVSEIKLYNEAKVAVGRKNKDLYERLKDDIERSRQTYMERIDADVAKKTNYFRDELVATLGEGDASALGPGLR